MAFTEVILTANIPSLGAEADIVKVRRGYARNFLFPHGKALEITSGSLRQINHLKVKRAEREAREMTAAEELASKINKLSPVFTLDAGETGKAFGSVTAKDIHDRLVADLKLENLPKHAVELEKPLKESGEHTVAVKLHADVSAKLKLVVKVNAPASAEADEASGEASSKKPRRKTTASTE
ncbi:MAG: 50S ribosomal protein L9 [Verrucomicrobiota bacterium]